MTLSNSTKIRAVLSVTIPMIGPITTLVLYNLLFCEMAVIMSIEDYAN